MDVTSPLRGLDAPLSQGCRVLSEPELGYADGAEQELLELVETVDDLSSSSRELADRAHDWATTYSTTPTRANVLRALDLPADAAVLEIGCGCGPITRYLGEQVSLVDSIEPMLARAAVARARTRDLDQVEVFVGTLDDVPASPTYDVVVVVGVLEYVGMGTADPAPYARFLQQCNAVLKPGGTLVLAIENPLGVKYLAGAVEDHTNRPFDSLEGYELASPARTFTRRRLEAMLADAEFDVEVLGAFPDYKLPRVVMDDALFAASPQLAHALPRFPSPDYLVPRLQLADERATWSTLVDSGVGAHFANSLLLLGKKDGDGASLWPGSRLAVRFSTDRQPEFAVRGEVVKNDRGLELARTRLFPERPAQDHPDVRHVVGSHETVVEGRDMLEELAVAPQQRGELLRRWVDLVPDVEWSPVDLVPHNVMVTSDGGLAVIDQEWLVRGYARDCLLLRGLVLGVVELASRTRPERWAPSTTVGDLVQLFADDIGLVLDDDLRERFWAAEAAFQAVVNTSDGTRSDRVARAAADLREIESQTLLEVRGGERFDVQWARAVDHIDQLAAQARQHVVVAEATADELADREASLAEHRQALAEARVEIADLLSRLPAARARAVLRRMKRLASRS